MSNIPTIEEVFKRYDLGKPLKLEVEMWKAYGESVRRETLKEAANKAKAKCEYRQGDLVFKVDKQSTKLAIR